MSDLRTVDMHAFADGQVGSKLWLCEELERLNPLSDDPAIIWVLGGWYGLFPFLLLTRQRLKVQAIRSFDRDPEALQIGDLINTNWKIRKGPFQSFLADCNELDYDGYAQRPHIVVNTSCEHFSSQAWWERVPSGTVVALQSTDMRHESHVSGVSSLDEMIEKYQPMRILYSGIRETVYPQSSFRRFTLIGVRG